MLLTERHKRLLHNLTLPRTVPYVTRLLAADPYSGFDATIGLADLANQVSALLAELLADGLVTNLGYHTDINKVIEAVEQDSAVPTLPPEKADQFEDRFRGRDRFTLREGELWYRTAAGERAVVEASS